MRKARGTTRIPRNGVGWPLDWTLGRSWRSNSKAKEGFHGTGSGRIYRNGGWSLGGERTNGIGEELGLRWNSQGDQGWFSPLSEGPRKGEPKGEPGDLTQEIWNRKRVWVPKNSLGPNLGFKGGFGAIPVRIGNGGNPRWFSKTGGARKPLIERVFRTDYPDLGLVPLEPGQLGWGLVKGVRPGRAKDSFPLGGIPHPRFQNPGNGPETKPEAARRRGAPWEIRPINFRRAQNTVLFPLLSEGNPRVARLAATGISKAGLQLGACSTP